MSDRVKGFNKCYSEFQKDRRETIKQKQYLIKHLLKFPKLGETIYRSKK